ncbi:MAG: hypothetical protein ABIA93_03800 [Candidatus Woesearchaeota archaeon]
MAFNLSEEIKRRIAIVRNLSKEELLSLSKIVKASFDNLDVFRFTNGNGMQYEYVQFPVTEGGVSPEIFEAIGLLIAWHAFQNKYVEQVDALFTESDYGGGQVITATSAYTGLKSYWANQYAQDILNSVPSITSIKAQSGYRSEVHVGVPSMEGTKTVLVVDDIISTGGTFKELLSSIKKMDVTPKAFYAVGEKLAFNGRAALHELHPELPIITLVQVKHILYDDAEHRSAEGKPIGVTKVVDDGIIFYTKS